MRVLLSIWIFVLTPAAFAQLAPPIGQCDAVAQKVAEWEATKAEIESTHATAYGAKDPVRVQEELDRLNKNIEEWKKALAKCNQ
jgi:anti-sigma factor RsiW